MEGRTRTELYGNLVSCYYEIRYNADEVSPLKNQVIPQKQSLRKPEKPNSHKNIWQAFLYIQAS